MTLFWTSFSFVAIYQHGYHGMEDWRSQVPPSAVDFRFLHPRPLASAALVAHCTYNVGVLYLFVWFSQLCPVCQPPKNMVHYIKVISNTTQHVFKHIWENTQNPRKNCSKKPENKSWWWLTDWGSPVLTMVVGLWILTQIDMGSPFPRGESPPRRTPYPPPGPRGYHKDAPRGSPFVVICEYSPYQRCCIRQAPRFFWPQTTPRRAVLKIRNVRPEKTLLLQLLHLIISITLRLVPPMEIRDTSSTRY